jgi:hypothetical protein
MKRIVFALCATSALAFASPAYATTEVGSQTGCADSGSPVHPNADKCAGYYSGNELSNSPADLASQNEALNALLGITTSNVDFDALSAAGKVIESSNGQTLQDLYNLVAGMTGQVIIGFHWGNVPDSGSGNPGLYGNVTAFYLWTSFDSSAFNVTPTDGWSNAAVYQGGTPRAVPEPATWAMMLLGFVGMGITVRRRTTKALRQLA